MKIKLWHVTHDSKEKPIMIELTEQDKINIANMSPECTKHSGFPKSLKWSDKEKLDWMKRS